MSSIVEDADLGAYAKGPDKPIIHTLLFAIEESTIQTQFWRLSNIFFFKA